jgi:CDP-diglyceride synthetase
MFFSSFAAMVGIYFGIAMILKKEEPGKGVLQCVFAFIAFIVLFVLGVRSIKNIRKYKKTITSLDS